ncbi:MAG: RHS repeat-associated core domain-containing protein [Candidatus Omnitrophota bacterium]
MLYASIHLCISSDLIGHFCLYIDNFSNTYNFTYNDAGHLTHDDKKDSQNNVIFGRDYSYDYAGNRTSETRDAASITYTYNDANQLVSRVISGGETISCTYDDNGNLTQQVSTLNGTTNYGYDLENRLVSAVTPSSSAYYGYSGDGRRTYSYIDNNEVEYIYDGLTPLIERNSPGSYLAAYTRLPGAPGGIGGLISSHDGTNTLYYHDSNLGNVNQVTNSAGVVIQTYDYDAFGYITAQTGALTAKYAYKTKEYSPETGLVFFGARYYNPLIGRFITPDPSGMVDGPNVYLYCLNDTINEIDLWGLETRTPSQGNPNSSQSFSDGKGGKTVREFGSDGKAIRDTDYGHNHGAGDPHAHDWDWSGKDPKRLDGRAVPKGWKFPGMPFPDPFPIIIFPMELLWEILGLGCQGVA